MYVFLYIQTLNTIVIIKKKIQILNFESVSSLDQKYLILAQVQGEKFGGMTTRTVFGI